jgi:hypothetical protein
LGTWHHGDLFTRIYAAFAVFFSSHTNLVLSALAFRIRLRMGLHCFDQI